MTPKKLPRRALFLLRMILKLEDITSGSIIVDGRDISKISEDHLITLRKKIGMVFQYSALFDSMTVGENVSFALREHTKFSDAKIREIAEAKLALVDLSGAYNQMPSEISGGMQKRVSIARALAFDPSIILYDEPTTGLDPITSTNIENLINSLGEKLHVTSVIVTHQLSTIFRTSDRIVMLHEGRFISCGSPDEARKSKNKIVRDFLMIGSDI